ncbi:helix-turn-helix transcriptional regulator [Chitinophaga sancti]|uniref:helix-turn-helix domain-containing protein n=1 Tax=Chitinophaga sancti TaxID=1004 RepID=UPI002A74D9B3|nr:helix-turn-helix transcriptional regulator [Chitinophaga sancti]WPQ63086.1 helix-turn-helix transcriptional regulator [Chitinophaga sancti]
MAGKELIRIKTISEFHRLRGLPKPSHPLISVVDYAAINLSTEYNGTSWTFDFYSIAVKRGLNGKMKYGQQEYDFDEGVMFMMSPHQLLGIEITVDHNIEHSGWLLLIHPDFFRNTSLAKNIHKYEFFDYTANEALFLSGREESILNNIIQNIQQEYHTNIDKFSQDIIISQIETLLNYTERFYQRQFITRKIVNHKILDQLETLLNQYFSGEDLTNTTVPTVQYVSNALNISQSYLSGLLKVLTGKSTQQHIHDKLIEKAKEKLSTSTLTVSEIAYALGFEHPQSFSKLFKSKTNKTPLEFRASFN